MEIIFNAAVGIILFVFLFFSSAISNVTVASDILGARGFPIIFSVIGLILLALSTFGTLRSKEKMAVGDDEAVLTKAGGKRVGLVILLLLCHILLVTYTGFTLTTLLFVFFSVTAIGYRNWKVSALFAFLMTALLVIVFGRVFYIALPRGVWLFKEISYYLY